MPDVPRSSSSYRWSHSEPEQASEPGTTPASAPSVADIIFRTGDTNLTDSNLVYHAQQAEPVIEGYDLMIQERTRISANHAVRYPFFTPASGDRCALRIRNFCGEVNRRFTGRQVKKYRFLVQIWKPDPCDGTGNRPDWSWGPTLTWDCSRTVFLDLAGILETESHNIIQFIREGAGVGTRYILNTVRRGYDLSHLIYNVQGQREASEEVPQTRTSAVVAQWEAQSRLIRPGEVNTTPRPDYSVEVVPAPDYSANMVPGGQGQSQSLEEEFFTRGQDEDGRG